MSKDFPRVSVGIPVYNGELYIKEAIESILDQTFSDFELIISDNGSCDATEQICRYYASKDSRVRYYRSDVNRGVSWNFRRVFELAKGEYFKWMSHDDVCHPRLLEKCVHALDASPSAIVCSGKLVLLEEKSTERPYKVQRCLGGPSPHRRYYRIMRTSSFALEIHGLFRSKVLRNTPLIASYYASDLALLARLVLRGPFIGIPEYLSYYRIHPEQSISRGRYGMAEWLNPVRDGRLSFPQWRLFWEYFQCIRSAPLPIGELLWCCFHLLCWPAWEWNWVRLGKDLLVVIPLIPDAMARLLKR